MRALCILFVAALALFLWAWAAPRSPVGGAQAPSKPPSRGVLAKRRSAHLVVDALNLIHHFDLRPSLESLAKMVEMTAPVLRKAHGGRVMYVVKDRDSRLNDEAARAELARIAREASVYVYAVERYEPGREPSHRTRARPTHAAAGRDDFYMGVLAERWQCAVLTNDHFRDFDAVKAEAAPFHVHEFAFWRELPARDYVRPSAHARLRRPVTIRLDELWPRPIGTRAKAAD
jgi:hypothetical protein